MNRLSRFGLRAAAALAAAVLFALTANADQGAPAPDLSKARAFREPVALAFSVDGRRLLTANRRTGSLSVIDPVAAAVLAEYRVGRGLADLAPLADGGHWLALDRAGDTLAVVALDDAGARLLQRLPVAPDPVKLAWDAQANRGVVASLGSRRLTFVELVPDTARAVVRVSGAADLPFTPRCVAILPGGDRVVAADAYGGRLVVIDPKTGTHRPVRSFMGQNVRGMSVTPNGDSLVVTYQELSPSARTDFEGVHWGRLLNNHLRTFRVRALLSARTDLALLDGSVVHDLGSFGNGAGDPAGLAVHPTGGVAVALAGVSEVTTGPHPTDLRQRTGVGTRPVAVAFAPDGRAVHSADSFDDTVSAVELPVGFRRSTVALGPRPELDAVARGERLFHDANLSHDRWMSCQSCHADGQTTGGLADTQGDDSYGTPKLIPSLLGVSGTGPWAWNGSVDRIEDQVRKSVETTMQGSPPGDSQVADLAAYLGSLAPPPMAVPSDHDEGAVARGRGVFRDRKCATCHAPPSYTTPDVYDVGLADERGRTSFNPPSLRGVRLRSPFLHDGRADRLEDVFLEHGHPRNARWGRTEVDDLAAFLRSL